MRKKLTLLQSIATITFVSIMLSVLIIFVAKKNEIEAYREARWIKTFILPKKSAGWRLISGNPDDICTIPVYEGETEISGWYVYDVGYDKKKNWLLKISDEDSEKLPLFAKNKDSKDFYLKVRIENASTELENRLKNASQENPVRVRISRYLAYCKGISLAKIEAAENI